MRKTNGQKGITLVALVITIIILLILAGISISSLTKTGIFQKANEAKQKAEEAEENQTKTLNEYENELDKYSFKNETYTIEYNGNGNTSGSMKNSICYYGIEKQLDLNKYKRDNYIFIGWSTEKDGNVIYTDGQKILNLKPMKGDNIILYAIWEQQNVDIPVTQTFWKAVHKAWDASLDPISSSGTVIWYNPGIYLKSTDGWGASAAEAVTQNKYKLDDYNKIIMSIDNVILKTGIGICLRDNSNISDSGIKNIKSNLITSGSPSYLELDISNITGEYFIGGFVYGTGNAMKITKVKLEK